MNDFFKKSKNYYTKKRAFTLSEVMLVMSVIGVIAALTIPGIVQNLNDRQTIVKLKKVYSNLSQAASLVIDENGGSAKNICATNTCIRDAFLKYMGSIKKCSSAPEPSSWDNCFVRPIVDGGKWTDMTGGNPAVGVDASAILPDGTFIHFWQSDATCAYAYSGETNTCTRIIVDINGMASPNITGKDIFYFALKENGIKPYGAGICNGGGSNCTSYYLAK